MPRPEVLRANPALLRAEQKRQRMEGILGENKSVVLQLDARRAEVEVPKEHKGTKAAHRVGLHSALRGSDRLLSTG